MKSVSALIESGKRHTREHGVRLAWEAQLNDLLKLILGQGCKLALDGALIGRGATCRCPVCRTVYGRFHMDKCQTRKNNLRVWRSSARLR
jgi:hypothetical protein